MSHSLALSGSSSLNRILLCSLTLQNKTLLSFETSIITHQLTRRNILVVLYLRLHQLCNFTVLVSYYLMIQCSQYFLSCSLDLDKPASAGGVYYVQRGALYPDGPLSVSHLPLTALPGQAAADTTTPLYKGSSLFWGRKLSALTLHPDIDIATLWSSPVGQLLLQLTLAEQKVWSGVCRCEWKLLVSALLQEFLFGAMHRQTEELTQMSH